MENEKKFYIDFNSIRMIYPREVSKKVTNLGVLEQYRDKKYTMKEINEIVAELIIRTPFISNSMTIKVCVIGNGGYHHILDLKNYEYNSQEREESPEIKYLY